MLIGFIWFISLILATVIGSRKGNPISGFLVGLLLGPIGVVIALVSGDKNRISCKFCAEKIMNTASICPHCQRGQS